MTIVLKRLSDRRVMQFWDGDHVLAERMSKDARDPQPKQNCCKRNGHLWDLAALYRAGVTWDESMPAAVVFDGPVVEAKEKIIDALARE